MSEKETIRFADFVASRLPTLYRYALVLTGSRPEAENLVEEALIRAGLAWREAGFTDPESYVRASMARLAASGRARPTSDEGGPFGKDAPGSITDLPPSMRTMLVLRYVDGHSPARIAELLGGSESAARKRLAEAVSMVGASEADITAALAEPAAAPPPDLSGRITEGIARRKRQGRKLALAIAAGLVLVVLLSVAVSTLRDEREPPDTAASATLGTPTSPVPRPTPVPSAPTAPTTLDQIIDRAGAVKFPVLQPDGLYFRAQALGPNGIIVGGTGLDYDPYRATDGRVWALGPVPGRRVALTQPPPRQPWAHAAGSTVAAWAEDQGDRFELFCADPNSAAPVARQVSRTGVATAEQPIHASGDVVVWADDAGAVQWVRGCGGNPRTLPVRNLLGLALPEVFHSDGGRVRAFNLESGKGSDVTGPLPDEATFAGNNTFVAWVKDGKLTVVDRRDGGVRTLPLVQLPDFAQARPGRLTMGDRLVAYAVRAQESDLEYGFVYDLISRVYLTTATEAVAHRDRLLWREGTSYLVATVKPA